MTHGRRNFLKQSSALAAGLAAGPLAGLSSAAHAADWPNRPIRLVVPYTAGGSSDIIARLVSKQLGEALDQSVVVDNRPGANGNVGAALVAQATDNHTLLLCDIGALAISPSVYTKLTFNIARDLKPVSMLAYSPHLLVVHPSVQVTSVKELHFTDGTSNL